jgi:uncharacterized protein (TIGR02145 family)
MIKIRTFLVLVGVVLFANSCFVFDKLDNTNLTPYLYTTSVTMITGTTAMCGGLMDTTATKKSRNASITSRGLCWSSSTTSPSIDDSKVMCGSGNSPFTGQLTGLSANTLYYVRAFAESSEGVGYGSTLQFNTTTIGKIETIPPLIEDIGETSIICGGNVLNDSNATVTSRGVCWGLSINPTIANSKTVEGSGLGPFTSTITGLKVGTSYTVRAYATSSLGTMYGENIFFSTCSKPRSCIDYEGNNYATIRIGAQVWMAQNYKSTFGGVTVVNDNLSWNTSTKPACYKNGNETLYNWYSVFSIDMPPRQVPTLSGWRVPDDEDWLVLEKYLRKKGLNLVTSGFNPVFRGYRSENGELVGNGTFAGWWSLSQIDSVTSSNKYTQNDSTIILNSRSFKNKGFSVRLIGSKKVY